jgi:hypothetical protein
MNSCNSFSTQIIVEYSLVVKCKWYKWNEFKLHMFDVHVLWHVGYLDATLIYHRRKTRHSAKASMKDDIYWYFVIHIFTIKSLCHEVQLKPLHFQAKQLLFQLFKTSYNVKHIFQVQNVKHQIQMINASSLFLM